MTDSQFRERLSLLERLFYIALIGLVIILLAFALPSGAPQALVAIAGMMAVIPVAIYLLLLTIWHWKSRYRGGHSDLWGGLLLFETSGWFKIVYFFRHILPDARSTGRYRKTIPSESA